MEGQPPKVDFCHRCGEYLRPGATFCPRCGLPIAGAQPAPAYPNPGAPYQTYQPHQQARTKRPLWAGVLLMLAGVVGFVMAAFVLLFSDDIIAEVQAMYQDQLPNLDAIILALAGFWVFAGAMSLLGGLCAIKRRYYALAVIGSIMALFTGGVLLFEGSLMGLIALVLLLTSRREFP